MSDSAVALQKSKKRRGWLRLVLWAAGGLVGLLVVIYFVVTSSAFFKGVILPRVSAAIHADVTVSAASIHPFKQVVLRDLKIQAKGQEPVITAPEVRLDYSLFAILGGNIRVSDVVLTSPTVQLVENADGSGNLDPILKAMATKPAETKPAAPSGPSKPAQVDLGKLTLSNATLLKIKNYPNGNRDLIEITNLNITLANVKNGQSGTLEIGAAARVENNPPSPGTNGLLQAALGGKFNFALTPALTPASVKGDLRLTVSQATGALSEFAALGAALNCDMTPTDIKEVALRFTRGDARLGELVASGPFDAEKMEGHVTVDLSHVDKQVLNLVGAASGIDFGPTTVSSTNLIQLSKSGANIAVSGQFGADKLQLTRTGQTTPSLDFHAEYDVTVDRTAQSALLSKLTLSGTQAGRALLDGRLTQPMNLTWGGSAAATGSSSFDLALNQLNLADWRPFLGDVVSAGDVGMKLNVASQQSGHVITFDLNSTVANLVARVGSNEVSQAGVTFKVQGKATDLKQINLDNYGLQVSFQNQPGFELSGSGTYNLADSSADLQVKLHSALARLLQALPQPGMTVSSGNLDLAAHVTQKGNAQSVTGDLTLTNFTGQFGSSDLGDFASAIHLDVAKSPEQVQIRKVTGAFSQRALAGGTFELSGSYQSARNATELDVKLADLNQNLLRPFLEPMLGNKKLASVDINAALSAQYASQGASTLKGNLQVTNLVVNDPADKFPATPLDVNFQVDTSVQKQVADVRQFQIALTPTDRAKNRLQLQGHVDFSQTTNIQGNIKLSSDSLDLTRYYDLFAGQPKTAEEPSAAPAPVYTTSPSSNPNLELGAISLPFHDFTASADIGKLYLHEIEISKLVANLNLDGGKVLVKPVQLGLNGAPVTASADLDLGVPGWTYDISLNANRIPVKPIADSLIAANGKYDGYVSANEQIKGKGITGVNLKQYLNGNASLTLSDANIQLIASHTKIFFIPINIKLIATLLNIPEIMESPVTGVNVKLNFGNGQIDLQQAQVVSPAFLANVHGAIPIADVLTNSPLDMPVEISLTNSLASKLALNNPQTSPTAGFTQLPVFVTVAGTIGNTEYKKNTALLASMTVRAAGGLVGGKVGEALKTGGGLVQGLEGLIEGNRSTGGNQNTNTNTNEVHKFNPFNLFKR